MMVDVGTSLNRSIVDGERNPIKLAEVAARSIEATASKYAAEGGTF